MTKQERFNLETMRFTASVMGNPEYLKATRNLDRAKDQRHEGLEGVNMFHRSYFEEKKKREKQVSE